MEHAVGNITKIAKALGFHENGLSECWLMTNLLYR
jgi:hypothetical protein